MAVNITAPTRSSQSRHKVVRSPITKALQFPTDNTVLCRWLGIETLENCQLVQVFPEILGLEKDILNLETENVVTFSNIRRNTVNGEELYFDLQIEPARYGEYKYALTLIDVTEKIHLQQSMPQLPEEYSSYLLQKNGSKLVELERHNRHLHLLNETSRTLITILDKEAVLNQLLQAATELIQVQGSSIWLWENELKEQLICRAVYHAEEEPALLNQRLQAGQGVGGTAVQIGQIVTVQDTHQDERFYIGIDERTGVKTNSIMAVPLQIHETSLGVLELVNKVEGRFTIEDQAMAETLATFAAVAIHNAQLVGSLRDSNEELDSFAHTVAHDLQNTLAIVIGFAELLRRDNTRLAEDRRKQIAEALAKNTYKMSSIIKELLLLSSVRKSDVSIAPINMKQIVEASLLRLSYVLEDYDAEIALQEQWPVALGHAAWIEEIWENYISNALKYGGDPPRVECGGEALPDGRVRFWVRDNGLGLTEAEQEKLFDPFVQLNKVRVRGSGLGLSIVQRIANKLGGEVGVASELGQGSTFSFTLPSAD